MADPGQVRGALKGASSMLGVDGRQYPVMCCSAASRCVCVKHMPTTCTSLS